MKALLLAASVLACIMRAAATPTGDAPAPVRLAVLADDALAETRALADLLTVELTKLAGVETVERGEVERVLAEHELTAAGVVSTEGRIALGRLLGAQGLVFVGYDAHGGRWLTRLVETRQGFLAAMFGTPRANQNPVEAAISLSRALPAHLSTFQGFSFAARKIGLLKDSVVVAVDGVEIVNSEQYKFVRDLDAANPRMELIFWNGDRYVATTVTLTDRRFGLSLEDYAP